MGLNTFLLDFYRLPIRDILILMVVATWIFLRLQERFHSNTWWRIFLLFCQVGSVAMILHLTVSTRESISGNGLYLIPFHSYREVLNGGNPEILRSNFMNAILFYPAGLLAVSLMPQKWPGWLRVALPLLMFAGFSAGVEFWQYANKTGLAEIDDVIHNVLGVLLGDFCSLIVLPKAE